MARRHSAASRSSSSRRRSSTRSGGAGRTGSSRAGSARAGGGSRARSDGKVTTSCPQCGAQYRVSEEMLDTKIECSQCHRVFFPKTTAGKRVAPPDYTKAYVGFGVAAVVIVGIFIAIGSGGGSPNNSNANNNATRKPVEATYSRGDHPRTHQLVAWAQSISDNNQLVLSTHSDMPALAKTLGVANDKLEVIKALREGEQARYLRDLRCDSATLDSEADMTNATGSGTVFVTPKAGNDDYKRNTRGEIGVTFKVENEQIKVTGFNVKLKPVWNIAKPKPGTVTYTPNKDIEKPDVVEISDSAGTRKVKESKPTPIPHWKNATEAQKALADGVVADIIKFATDPEAPGGLFNGATLRVREMADIQATVPRVLNAMHDCYGDVITNHETLILLDKALQQWTGYGVNYPRLSSGNPDNDKKRRESCIRQWFAFWWRYHEDLSEFIDQGDDLESLDDEGGDKKK